MGNRRGQMIKHDDIVMRRVAQEIKHFPKRGYRLLDIGCADKHLKDLLPANVVYYSMDYKDADFIIDLDVQHLNIGCEFDIIVCLETLEHTIKPHAVMKEILKLGAKDAVFFLSMPNEYNFYCRINFIMGKKTSVQKPFRIAEDHLHIHYPRIIDIKEFFSQYIRIRKSFYCWYSRKSEHGNFKGLFIVIDKLINQLAEVYPSLFSRNMMIEGVKRCNKKHNNTNIKDKCMIRFCELLNSYTSITCLASCCGHGKYPLTIVVKDINWKIWEFFSRIEIPRTRNFYKRDKQGFFYIPELLEVKHGRK
jgi:hypothetical protein